MPKNLLLADDSITIQKVVGIIFATEDYRITAVDNGEDALRKARETRPDVVLADVVMPRMNGYELCEALKRDPELASVPVLLLAGTFEAFDEGRARAARADGHIAKPFESQALLSRVKELVEGVAAAPAPQPYPRAAAPAPAPPRTAAGPQRPAPAGPPVRGPVAAPRPPGAPAPVPQGARPLAQPVPPAARSAVPPGRPLMPSGVQPPRAAPPAALRPPPGAFPPGARPPTPGMAPRPGPSPVPGAGRPTIPQPGVRPAAPVGPLPGAARPFAPPPAATRPVAPTPAVVAPPEPPRPPPEPLHAVPDLELAEPAPLLEAAPLEADWSEVSLDEPGALKAPPVRHAPPPQAPSPAAERPVELEAVAPPVAEAAAAVAPEAVSSLEKAPPPPPAPTPDAGEAQLRQALSQASREVIEKVVWEVVPQLAEVLIREQLDRLVSERQNR